VSNVSNYSWRQYDVPDGLYYYRLKQLDEDGKYSYSDVISVRVGKNVAPRLSPNPVEQVMRISGGKSFEYKVAIFSTSGVSMYEGVTTGELNVDFLSPGIYLVQLTSESGVIVTERMVKK
jgi:hypothetical protein